MLETVRAYAVLELNVAGEHEDAMDGLCAIALPKPRSPPKGSSDLTQAEWLDRVQEDARLTAAALTWLIERGRPTKRPTSLGADVLWMIAACGRGSAWYEGILNLPYVPRQPVRALVGAALMWFTQRNSCAHEPH